MTFSKLIPALIFTVLTALGAQVNISLPYSPVPFILSDFFIILGALYLGSKWAVISTGFYLVLGAVGLPVFSDGAGGIQHFTGPTGGYLFGFLAAAFVIGFISERRYKSISKDFMAWMAGAWCIFFFGVTGLVKFANMAALEAIEAGFVPFIPAATTKGIVAIILVQYLRKIQFNRKSEINPD